MSETDICCVCHENLDENADPCFSCNNRIHPNCWARWIAVRNNCPMCRTSQGTRRGGLEVILEEDEPIIREDEPETPPPNPESPAPEVELIVDESRVVQLGDPLMDMLIPDGNGSLTTVSRLLEQNRELQESRTVLRERLRTRHDTVVFLRAQNTDLERLIDRIRMEHARLEMENRLLREENDILHERPARRRRV
jgi:hypothetical protein